MSVGTPAGAVAPTVVNSSESNPLLFPKIRTFAIFLLLVAAAKVFPATSLSAVSGVDFPPAATPVQ